MIVFVVITSVMVLSLAGCLATLGLAAHEVDNLQNREHNITYQVNGKGKGTVMPTTQDGSSTMSDVKLPWHKDFTVKGDVNWLAITAGNGAEGDDITCKIYVDGYEVVSNTGKGAFANASCSYIDDLSEVDEEHAKAKK